MEDRDVKEMEPLVKGAVLRVEVNGKPVCTRVLAGRLESEQSVSVDHRPQWGLTVLRYPIFEGTETKKDCEELRNAVRCPGWVIVGAEVDLATWKARVHLANSETAETKSLELTQFQPIIEALGLIQYLYAVSPIAPRATGR